MNHNLLPPDPSQAGLIHPPMVYVKTHPKWEYKQLVRNLAKEAAPTENELTALGADGWELASVFTDTPSVYFYFKRLGG